MPSATARDEIVELLQKELLGPREGPGESFLEQPTQRYIVGVLYPQDTRPTIEEEAETDPEGEGDDEVETRTVRATSGSLRRPSIMGLSFLVDERTSKIVLKLAWATYTQLKKFEEFTRHEHTQTFDLDVSTTKHGGKERLGGADGDGSHAFVVQTDVYPGPKGANHVDVFLINEEAPPADDPKTGYPNSAKLATSCIYSPRMEVLSDPKSFVAMHDLGLNGQDWDLATLKLLYRARREFAYGHGCAAEWSDLAGNRCGRIVSTFIPRFRQASIDVQIPGLPDLRMVDLSEPYRSEESLTLLGNMLERYERWIDSTFSASVLSSLEAEQAVTCGHHATRARDAVRRMREGLELLSKDPVAFRAFCFMNEAMFWQKAYAEAARGLKDTGTFKDPDVTDPAVRERHIWRAFQMAFILMNLPGIVDAKHKDREVVDLLWVPTGGGKTEAYLGLAVFAMVDRRLRHGTGDSATYAGVCVLLRYTLRLLTIQQFQRAVSLMCACEFLRLRRVDEYGTEPFSVGLFIGESTTPNRTGEPGDFDAYNSNRYEHPEAGNTTWYAWKYWESEGLKPQNANPFQLSVCPWCGTELTLSCYKLVESYGKYRLVIHCPRGGCFFNTKAAIPAVMVDDEIFAALPPFIIATVDKFAMLPLRPKIAMLFGHVSQYCPVHGYQCIMDDHPSSHRSQSGRIGVLDIDGLPPPDLIIQDELHLINGPLGSLVGMYEGTIHYLCRRMDGGTPSTPKIVAATATVRRAPEQVWNLYLRDLRPFPPPGVDFEDSFFVRERENPDAKMYVGLFPSGTALATAFIRTTASLMESASRFRREGLAPGQWEDYWTVVSYFNSIRELGSSKTRIEDDIQRRVSGSRGDIHVEELTSRVDSKDLPDVLAKLSVLGGNPGAVDVLACSNMFSVGVDVQRLGVMVVYGQPKSAAEYIQATGRVGRRNAGLVVVLYNWARARDQSHFERFDDFHRRIHMHVESLTVTPFSAGVRNRALHAQYVIMARTLLPGLAWNVDAARFDTAMRNTDAAKAFEEWLRTRAGQVRVDPEEVEAELDDFIDRWIVDAPVEMKYVKASRFERRPGCYLLRRVDDEFLEADQGPRKLTPTSLRNIEVDVAMHDLNLRTVEVRRGA